MKPAPLIAIAFSLIFLTAGCTGSGTGFKPYPTYPSGGDYYDDGYNNYDDYIVDYSGEWEGFMWEHYRSDYLSPGKKKLAVRVRYRDSTRTYSGWHDWYKIDVLIDGRPVASTVEEIHESGYMHLNSYTSGIDLDMQGWFRTSSADGNFSLDWEEKFKNPWDGDTIKLRVRITGDYDMGRVHGLHWASAWDLFDTYGDGIWDLPDETWETATLEGLTYLDSLNVEDIRTPAP